MSRRRRSANANIDSLLDTMANVVGILVVVMAFTQIHVGEAIRRIQLSDRPPAAIPQSTTPSPPTVAERDVKLALRSEERRLKRDLLRTQTASEIARAEIPRLEGILGRLASLPAYYWPWNLDVDQKRAEIERATRELVRLEDQRNDAKAAHQRLKIQIEGSQARPEQQVHRVRLPDPRPAPPRAKEMSVFCRYDRVTPVDVERLLNKLNAAGRRAVHAGSPREGYGASLQVSYFRQNDVGDENFRWILSDVAGRGIHARLKWRKQETGEEADILDKPGSDFRRFLSEIAPRNYYLTFHVWGDSFEPYLRARELAEQHGFSVGWQVYEPEGEYEGLLVTNAQKNPVPID